MLNWFKKSTDNSRHQSVDGTVSNSHINFGDTITTIINIPKKILIPIVILLISLIVALVAWKGNHQTVQVNNGTVNQIQGNVINNQYGVSQKALDNLNELLDIKKIEISKREDIQKVEISKRDALIQDWVKKYKELESQLASRNDDTAKQAKVFLNEGNLEQAEKLFKQSLASKLTIVKEAAAEAFALAQIKELQLNQAEAKTYYNQATQLDSDNADYWNQLGNFLKLVGDLDEAMTAYSKVLALGETHQNQQEIAWAYGNLGLVYRIRGDLDKAVEMHNKALQINESLGNKESMAKTYGNLGIVYQIRGIRGDLDKAIEMHNKALQIYETLGNKESMAKTYSNLEIVYTIHGIYGDLNKAAKVAEMHNKASQIYEALGHKLWLESNYINLLFAYRIRGDLDEVIKMQNELNKVLDSKKWWLALNYGKIRGDWNKVIEMHNKDLQIDEVLGRKKGWLALNYGRIHGNSDKAIEIQNELYKVLGSKEERLALNHCSRWIEFECGMRRYLYKDIEIYQQSLSLTVGADIMEMRANENRIYRIKGNKADTKRY